MATNLLRQSGEPKVGRYPTSVINDAVDGRDLVDGGLKTARPQPVIWQPILASLKPTWLHGSNSGTGYNAPATVGDLLYCEGGLGVFNGRVWKDLVNIHRLTYHDKFLQLPQLVSTLKCGSTFQINHTYSVPTVDLRIFTATAACKVVAASITVTAQGTGGACTFMLEKVPSGVAIGGGGTQKNLLTAGLSLVGSAANTVANGTLTSTAADLVLVAGDSLALNLTGTATNATGVVTVTVQSTETIANRDWMLSGTNASNVNCAFFAAGGMQLVTSAANEDQLIITPRTDTGVSLLGSVAWNTDKLLLLEANLRTYASITNMRFWAGWRLTNPAPFDLTTDDDQLILYYDVANGYLKWATGIGGTDATGYVLDKDGEYITVTTNTDYAIEVGVDANRLPYIICNGVLTPCGSTAMTASLATLIPTIGVETDSGAKRLIVRNIAVSQNYV